MAAIALYATMTAGFQGALMVPTEILAQQHMESLQQLFDPLEVRTALLTGSTKTKERRLILEELANGEIDIVVGTHALIQQDVSFHQLGLVITDEQHRFGVNQRKILREKGLKPDVLFMTATRFLERWLLQPMAKWMYQSLMKCQLDGFQSKHVDSAAAVRYCFRMDGKELARGHQAYIICPLIEESEALDVKNATEIFEHMQSFYSQDIKWDYYMVK